MSSSAKTEKNQPPAKSLKKRLEDATTNLLLVVIIGFCAWISLYSVLVLLNRHNEARRAVTTFTSGGPLK